MITVNELQYITMLSDNDYRDAIVTDNSITLMNLTYSAVFHINVNTRDRTEGFFAEFAKRDLNLVMHYQNYEPYDVIRNNRSKRNQIRNSPVNIKFILSDTAEMKSYADYVDLPF